MSIVSISRMQHRRGIKSDLPTNLFEGELGWCLDTRELYIGNGPTTIGNSQILSQYSKNDQLITHIYKGNLSIPAVTGKPFPVSRPIGAILDDQLSVKAYGAMGDGQTDDTIAIQSAINDRWDSQDFRIIYFPAGTYIISNTIYLRPTVLLVGEGSTVTQLTMIQNGNAIASVISTADSDGQIGYNIGLSNATLPNNITIRGFTINISQLANIVTGIQLQRSSNVNISDINVIGNWTTGQNPLTDSTVYMTNGITIETLGTLHLADNIKINKFTATGVANGICCNDIARYITVDEFDFNNCFRGVVFGPNTITGNNGPSYVKFTNGSFRNIDSYGLCVKSSNPGIISSNNVYDTVGEVLGNPPIYFDPVSNNCSSINDTFSLANNFIELGNATSNIIASPQKVSLAIQKVTPIGPITLLDNKVNTSCNVSWDITLNTVIFLHYSIQRSVAKRAGRLTLLVQNTTVTISDDGIDAEPSLFGVVGVTWSATVVGNFVNLLYTTTSIGVNGNFWYTQLSWLM